MFLVAILIGIYSYLIFALGLLGFLYKPCVAILTIVYILIVFYYYRKKQRMNLLRCFERSKKVHGFFSFDKLSLLMILILFLQVIINLIGALGPELGFDALWYHLTIPKLYLGNHSIFYVPGGLLYYSTMPKLTEMFYLGALALGSEILAKFVHFLFGVLSLIALYKLSRNFFSSRIALLTLVIFYSNPVVGWMSITAYVDLTRTFFEVMALYGFLNWWKRGEKKWFIESAVMLGLAVSTKLLALGSLFIFTILIIFYFLQKNKSIKDLFIGLLAYWIICLLIPLPWFVFSNINTGNPVYPFFTDTYPVNLNFDLINPLRFINDIWVIFTKSADPISPIYIVFLPVALFLFKKLRGKIKIVYVYSFLAILVWYITPRTGGGRFILPYLPAFSILVVYVISIMKNTSLRKVFIVFIILTSLFSIIYRFGANLKYIPVIVGYQSKSDFLINNLNYSFGDFYDTDGFFRNKITKNDKVLLYGFHNLYYVNFPFVDSSFVKRGDGFNYIAVQNANLPKRFSYWNLTYYNPITKVKLYSLGGQKWIY